MSNCDSCPSKGSCGQNSSNCSKVVNPYAKIKHVIAVMSGKGGVGKSSMCVMLAKALTRKQLKVGILDADITGPSIPRLLNQANEVAFGKDDAIVPVVDENGILSMSLNYLLEEENRPVIWRGAIINNAIKQFYRDVLWGELDVLLIDMPPGTGDIALTVLQDLPVEGVVMVSTPQDMVSMIVSKAINMCKEVNVEVYGVIENMSYVECPDCGKKIDLYPQNNLEEFLAINEVDLWATLPMNIEIASLNQVDSFDAKSLLKLNSYIDPCADALLKKLKKA